MATKFRHNTSMMNLYRDRDLKHLYVPFLIKVQNNQFAPTL